MVGRDNVLRKRLPAPYCCPVPRSANASSYRRALFASPFVPFIILFCLVMETSDPIHLGKLGSVVEALDLLPADFPNPLNRQLRLFKAMHDVACKFVEARSRLSAEEGSLSMDGDFEMFLREACVSLPAMQTPSQPDAFTSSADFGCAGSLGSALGLAEQHLQMPSSAMENHGAGLGNWFDQNQEIFRMLEDTDQ
jgi:hypothetical protein